jgi:hypothetical protein
MIEISLPGMEQHPVPQNVTTFQFRLIGDMTLKQFGYLCAGAILAFVAYKLPLPFIITWPLTFAFAFLGVGFAFIPIEERPMDVWVFSFFKSVYNPTQYVWSHEPQPASLQPAAPPSVVTTVATTSPSFPAVPAAAPAVSPKSVLTGIFQQTTQAAGASQPQKLVVAAPRSSFMEELASFFRPKHTPSPAQPVLQVVPAAVPSVTGYRPAVPAAAPAQAEAVQQKMAQLETTLKTLEERLASKTVTEDRVLELQKQLTEALSQKTKTEDELIALKRQLTKSAPSREQEMPAAQSQLSTEKQASSGQGTVNVITTQEGAVKVGLPRLTNAPNVITGLVKDDAKNFLPGILVTVTNHEGVPVRALKTNKLGQFAASTPLASGTYFVEIEDPRGRFTFSRVQITLTGAVVPILEIIAKSEKVLTRERLAQEIFGKPIP